MNVITQPLLFNADSSISIDDRSQAVIDAGISFELYVRALTLAAIPQQQFEEILAEFSRLCKDPSSSLTFEEVDELISAKLDAAGKAAMAMAAQAIKGAE